jgi:hypothetical protein
LLKIKIFRDSIQKTILENPVIKEESYASTEISEIDNCENDGNYSKFITKNFSWGIWRIDGNFPEYDSYSKEKLLSTRLILYC